MGAKRKRRIRQLCVDAVKNIVNRVIEEPVRSEVESTNVEYSNTLSLSKSVQAFRRESFSDSEDKIESIKKTVKWL